jgi:hypothetical protein
MASSHTVLNVSRGYFIRYRHALKGIENCAFAWVIVGESVRDLTIAEQISSRNEQAKLREPLEYAELPGIMFVPPIGAEKANTNSGTLVWEAHKFAREFAAEQAAG